MSTVLHVARAEDWEAAQETGTYPAPDGGPFLHCCSQAQLPGVLKRFFRGSHDGLQILVIDPEGLDIRMETAPDGAGDFPHLYGSLPVSSVTGVRPLGQNGAQRLSFRNHLERWPRG